MEDRTCPNCKYVFKYPCFLKTHLKTALHCLMTDEEFTKYINDINYLVCGYCKKEFANKRNLERHKNDSKCGKKAQMLELEKKKKIEREQQALQKQEQEQRQQFLSNLFVNLNPDETEFFKNLISKMSGNANIPNQQIQQLPQQPIPQQQPQMQQQQIQQHEPQQIINNGGNIQQANNIENTNSNNVDNSRNLTIINNNTITNHIMPFGYEDVRKISKPEMLRILKSGSNAGLEIIKAVYSKLENKNYFKHNISKNDISILSKAYDFQIYKEKEFADTMFNRCICLLHHLLYLCKDDLEDFEIQDIYSNIEEISTVMRKEIYDNGLQNIISAEIRNLNSSNRASITRYINDLRCNPEVKEEALNIVNEIINLNSQVLKSLKPSITEDEINYHLGDPKKAIALKPKNNIKDFQTKQFEETQFNLYWQERLKEEKEIFDKRENKTIGDIINFGKRCEKIHKRLAIVQERHMALKPGETHIDLKVGSDYEDTITNSESENDVANLDDLHEFDEIFDRMENMENIET